MVQAKFRKPVKPSIKKVSANRAGGESFDIECPVTKLISMVGGSFFAEPRYYDDEICLNKNSDKLVERINIAYDKTHNIPNITINCENLDSVSHEIISTAWDILNGDNPKDLLHIACWLRTEMNIRLTPQVFLVLASRHSAAQQYVREYATKIIQRPDEIKTAIVLHRFFFGMKNIKNCLSRGLSDAMSKVSEKALIKYEGKHWPSWKDVLNTIHRKKNYPVSKELYEYFCYGRTDKEKTPVAYYRSLLYKETSFEENAKEYARKSSANWEVLLSKFGNTKEIWSFLIDEDLLGYMALLRNLRNIVNADVSKEHIEKIAQKLSNEKEVINSRQLPFRYVSAANILNEHIHGDHYSILMEAIEDAIDISIKNNMVDIPGTTVIFADNSGSMGCGVSGKSTITCLDAANTLAAMFAKKSEKAKVFAFATAPCEVKFTKNTHTLALAKSLKNADTKGVCTYAHKCLEYLIDHKIKADRIILLSDMQCYDGYGDSSHRTMNDLWNTYRNHNSKCWLHSVDLHGYGDSSVLSDKYVSITGSFSEKIIGTLMDIEQGGSPKVTAETAPTATIEKIRTY